MKRFKYILLIFFNIVAIAALSQKPFTAGNLVVYRIGDGSSTLSTNADKVFLDEYTPSGVLVQSIQMPSTGQKITMAGGIVDGGYLTLSANGKYLVVPGWNADLGTSLSSVTASNRSVALVDFNGLVNSINVVTGNPTLSPINGAASNDGNNIWMIGGTEVEQILNGSNTSNSVASLSSSSFAVSIAGGGLYASTNINASPLVQIGSGLPTTAGQTFTNLPGIPSRTRPRQFAFADLSNSVPGNDVLYLASQNPLSPGGIQKYSLVNGSWVSNGQVGTTAESYAGLTISVTANGVTIFATRQGGNSSGVKGGELVKLVDNTGYNGTLTGTPTVLASVASADTKSFRGIALVPQPSLFTPGNIAVYRVGDGSSTLGSNASKVFIDEYTPAGVLVQSFLMPVSGKKITMAGGLPDAGQLSLSADGKYLVVPGWDADEGASLSSATANNRSVGLIDFNGSITSVNSITNNPGISPINSAASNDGSDLWILGGTEIEHILNGTNASNSVSSLSSSLFSLGISEGQLYASTNINASPLVKIGSGLPTTSGNSFTTLPGIPARTRPRQFAFADMEPSVPGADVLYLASQNPVSPGGIQKYSLVNGTWVSNGQIGTTADGYSGLMIKVSGNVVTIFATRQGTNNSTIKGGELVSLTDNSGYNGTLTGTPIVIASIVNPNTKAFRGLSKVPSGCPAVANIRVPDISSTAVNIVWDAPVGGSGNYEYAITTSSTPPPSGTATNQTTANITGLTNGTSYYTHVRTRCTGTSVSEWSTTVFVTGCKAPPSPSATIDISGTGVTTAKWNKVFGAASYEYLISTNATPPGAGISITDSFVVVNNLNPATQYYLHVRSNCGSGSFSSWTTKPFMTGCFMPSVTINSSGKGARAQWTKINSAMQYEYALTTSAANPLSGVFTIDTFHVMNELGEGSNQYFHVRTICGNGSVSAWSTVLFSMQGLSVYPNPVKDLLKIQLNGIINSSSEISIADATGRVVTRVKLNNSTAVINMRGWAPGIYLVRYDDGKNSYTERIVKQ